MMLWQKKRYEKNLMFALIRKGRPNKIFCLAQNCAILHNIPHNRVFVTHNLPPKSHTILTFFPHPVRSPDDILINLT